MKKKDKDRRGRGDPRVNRPAQAAESVSRAPHLDPASEHAVAGLRMHVDERISRLQKQLEELAATRRAETGIAAVEIRGATGSDIVDAIRRRHAANGVSQVGFNETPPSTFHEALERAKSGELRRWHGPQFQLGAAEHTLSEVVQVSKRLDVIESFLEHLVRAASR